ncbi:MAG: M28 family peptidase [Flavobacteriaceae bacterium]|nr:M28 family peptidase [Flavobacteriaceae bacterium]
MKKILSILLILSTFVAHAQSAVIKNIADTNPRNTTLQPLYFLASDELMGRSATRPEANIAARYIGEMFRSYGLKEANGTKDYFQEFDIHLAKSPDKGGFTINENHFQLMDNLLLYEGKDSSFSAPVVYVGYGTKEELEKADVKGKIVITDFGLNENSSMGEAIMALFEMKKEALTKKGALAIIERYQNKGMPWEAAKMMATQELAENPDSPIKILFVNDTENKLNKIPANSIGELSIENTTRRTIKAKNVMGFVEGTDPKLKKEFVLLSAHYDHMGVAPAATSVNGKMDSIFNGARDNAIGVTAIISAARYFAKHPPKRSVLFVSFAAEEIGLVGSKHFVENPPLPLNQIIFNLNNDNAGYNNTSAISVLGSGRTSADAEIRSAATAYKFKYLPEPSPEENLFMRSDNFPLAQKGIPAITFTMGIDKVDEKVNETYHKVTDEVGNMDLDYAVKFIHSYILAAKNIADNPKQPTWNKGEMFETEWQKLYGNQK